jgi:hypothetical protein
MKDNLDSLLARFLEDFRTLATRHSLPSIVECRLAPPVVAQSHISHPKGVGSIQRHESRSHDAVGGCTVGELLCNALFQVGGRELLPTDTVLGVFTYDGGFQGCTSGYGSLRNYQKWLIQYADFCHFRSLFLT